MELHILEHRLRVCTVKRSDLLPFIGSLIKLALLHEYSNSKFFSFTLTSRDFTIILDEEGFKALPDQAEKMGMVIQSSAWLVLEATAGNDDAGMTTITRNIIVPLADRGLSIFCLSTCQTDYVLVREEDLPSVTHCLAPQFSVFREIEGNSEPVTLDLSQNGVHEPEAKRAIMYPLHFPTNSFLVTSLQPDMLPKITSSLLQVLFYPETCDLIETESSSSQKEQFVSYSLIDDRISLVLDVDLLDRFPDNCICVDSAKERWRMVNTGVQNTGFEECGIVAQIAEPLASENIPIFYLSTFLTDHTLVPETEWNKTLTVLSHREECQHQDQENSVIVDQTIPTSS
ncbi:cytosolic arginine sensor for mTORC1 subunit 2-like [Lytechinus variegatus]|uniref:cytosolic arginine sensor for mTORC1 subunit 2-like n=1 Tax=Lytechinus variegatus TaxID=7654 RepID=UPI001BB1173F|nr:cytosolic arginine sensor for mTORC1 subunit 2-like [Lytechinus variegatus]XP_041455722.1 cytosolic arginine sensor for mTORC1 subunit 2-like [Lytechinus variegatus]